MIILWTTAVSCVTIVLMVWYVALYSTYSGGGSWEIVINFNHVHEAWIEGVMFHVLAIGVGFVTWKQLKKKRKMIV